MTTTRSFTWDTAGSYTWTVPDTPPVYLAWVTVLGAGAGGHGEYSGSHRGGQGGGAGEQLVQMPLAVTPAASIAVVVGAKGSGGFFTNSPFTYHPATVGGDSSFGPYVALGGGNFETGGTPQQAASYGGGVNGGLQGNSVFPVYSDTWAAADGTFWFGGSGGGAEDDPNHEQGHSMPGGPAGGRLIGGAGQTKVTDGPGGGGAATLEGVGGAGGGDNADGANAAAAGAGGGGSGYFTGTIGVGGDGFDGKVTVFWIQRD